MPRTTYLSIFGSLWIFHEIPKKCTNFPQAMRAEVFVLESLSLFPFGLLFAFLLLHANFNLGIVFQSAAGLYIHIYR